MPDGEITERHCRSQRQPSLVADALLGCGGGISRSVEPRNRTTPLMDHPRVHIGQQPSRGTACWVQLDAIERWFFDGTETTVAGLLRSGGELPLVLTAMKILIHTARGKAVEAANRLLQAIGVYAQHRGELRERSGTCDCPRHDAADRAVGKRKSLKVLRVKNQIGREIGIFMTCRIEHAQVRYNSLKERLVGKAFSVPVHQECMRAA